MKQEFEIAKQKLENVKKFMLPKKRLSSIDSHKQTCERFLEFLEYMNKSHAIFSGTYMNNEIKEKIKDLQKTIKLYEENKI